MLEEDENFGEREAEGMQLAGEVDLLGARDGGVKEKVGEDVTGVEGGGCEARAGLEGKHSAGWGGEGR